jgi:hypothetical protein
MIRWRCKDSAALNFLSKWRRLRIDLVWPLLSVFVNSPGNSPGSGILNLLIKNFNYTIQYMAEVSAKQDAVLLNVGE